jgi:hypothetical protein
MRAPVRRIVVDPMMPVGDFLRLLGIYDDEVEMVVDGQPILLVLHRSDKSDSPMSFEEHAKMADGTHEGEQTKESFDAI